MFDDLNDPEPPLADMATLNRVANRAEQLRRRRALIVGTGAGAFAIVATLATVALLNRDDADDRLVVDVTPSSAPLETSPETTTVTSTTVVVGLTTTSTATATPVVAPTTATTPAPPVETIETAPETTVVDTTLPPETTTTMAATTTTAPSVTGPIVAIDANGDAVVVSLDGANTLLYDGTDPDDPPPLEGETTAIDAVAITPDRSHAYIGICCEPVAGSLLQTTPPTPAGLGGPSSFGHGPALSPSATTLGRIVYDALVVSDLAVNQLASTPENFDLGFTYDLAWADDQHLLALRSGPAGTDLRVLAFGSGTLTETVAAPSTAGATFAGRAPGVVYLLGVAPGTLSAYDSTTLAPLPDRNIAVSGAISAWVDTGAVRWVDSGRQLHVGDAVVPGQYVWVR